MLNQNEIMQTIQMIDQQHLDVRTITMGISLLSCAHSDVKTACDKVYDKITRYAEKLVVTGEAIEKEFGIPIVNKRISVTPSALVAAAAETDSYVPFAQAMDRAAHTCGVNFIGGFSALVQKGMTQADRILIASIPEALATTISCAPASTWALPRRVLTWMQWPLWAGPSRTWPSAPPTRAALAAPSWWSFATRWRTTPSWRALSTGWASPSG